MDPKPTDHRYTHIITTLNNTRTDRDITIRSLAHTIGCSPSTLTENLRGIHRMSAHTLIRIADALDCDITLTQRQPPTWAPTRETPHHPRP